MVRSVPIIFHIHFYKESIYGTPQRALPETLFNKHIAEELSPTCIYIDRSFNILFINGNVNDYLKIGRGQLQQDLLKMMVNEKMNAMVRNGVRRLKEERKTIVFKGVTFENNNQTIYVDIQFSSVKN
ncbi:MAG: hypothetical protein HC905_05680 [Bacteroidales bacterium]|nr:hypothetical protein [Bacteroidales bacterium]